MPLQTRTLHRACLYLSWSPDGNRLAAVGQDDDHTLHVFSDWKKVRFPRYLPVCHLLAWPLARGNCVQGSAATVVSAETDKAKILDLAFGDSTIVTVGANHVMFWDVTGRSLRGKKGLFTVRDPPSGLVARVTVFSH